MNETIKLTILSILWVVVITKVWQVSRAPEDRPLRCATAGLACVAAAFTLGQEPFEPVLNSVLAGLPRLLLNCAGASAFYGLLGFFTYSVHGDQVGRRMMRRHLAVLGAALACVVASWAAMPLDQRANPATPTTTGHPLPTVFEVSLAVAWVYALVGSLRHTVRSARVASQPRLRRGLWTTAIGETILLIKVGQEMSLVAAAWLLPPDSPLWTVLKKGYLVTMLLGPSLLAVGLASPVVVSLVREALPQRRHHQQQARRLLPLWRDMRAAFPTLVLRGRRPGVHGRRYRRALEIRDALTWLGPHYPRQDVDTRDLGRVADHVRAALEAKRRGDAPQPAPHPIPVPDVATTDDEVAWLVQLSEEVKRRRAAAPSAL